MATEGLFQNQVAPLQGYFFYLGKEDKSSPKSTSELLAVGSSTPDILAAISTQQVDLALQVA